MPTSVKLPLLNSKLPLSVIVKVSTQPLPDALLNNLVASRLKQADCRINGWILDDYGYTPDQIANFKALRIKPSVVLAMD